MPDNGNINPLADNLVFPRIQVQIAPQGMTVTTLYSPFISYTVLLDANTCNEICKQWLSQRKVNDNMIDLAQRIIKDKRGN